MSDRTVHATNPGYLTEVVRYNKAGKWYFEEPGRRRPLTLLEAVKEAEFIAYCNGDVRLGLPGGGAFDRLYLKRNPA
jgi:hypothetical protein